MDIALHDILGSFGSILIATAYLLIQIEYWRADDLLFSAINAVGAAIAQVSGEVERVVTLNETNRRTVLDDARQEAKDKTISAGATAASVEIIEVEQVPISYLPGNPTRLRVNLWW